MGHTTIGWMWLRQATVANKALDTALAHDQGFYKGKLQAAQFFALYELPKIKAHADLPALADDTTLKMQNDWF